MKVIDTDLPGLKVLEPKVFGDARGFFQETWNARTFRELGLDFAFVQDNHSRSARGILRGLHYQIPQPQGKLVRVTAGAVFDVAVDLRRTSPTFGQWFGTELTAENHRMMWVPVGFAHGFLSLTDGTDFMYKCTDYYAPEHERVLRWDDPDIGISWPLADIGSPRLAARDQEGLGLGDAETFD